MCVCMLERAMCCGLEDGLNETIKTIEGTDDSFDALDVAFRLEKSTKAKARTLATATERAS